MKRAAGINEARSILTTWFGVEAADCDELLRTWSEQTQAPVGKLPAVLPPGASVTLEPREGLAGATQADLALGSAVGVVEDGRRGTPLGHPAQVGDGERGVQAALPLVELDGLGPQQRLEL